MMKKDLYVFNKKGLHAKFFKWIWGVDPVREFPTMCPYFWSYVATIVLLPVILFMKGLVSIFSKIPMGEWSRKYSNYRDNKKLEKITKLSKAVKTPLEAYVLKHSKCWDKDSWRVESELYNRIYSLSREYAEIIQEKKKIQLVEYMQKRQVRLQKYEEIKESKYTNIIFYIIVIALTIFLLYWAFTFFVWLGTLMYTNSTMIFNFFKLVGLIVLIISAIGIAVTAILYGIEKLRCSVFGVCIGCYLRKIKIGSFFNKIFSGIAIVFDMIRATYKKHCPIITWQDENN